ncbi:hypothetical protein [Sinomonas mesophila]|uniref:hypothetical protein n=1 Tax=Sinomonas mesophila TaxID=1531955 RepID=UPI00098477ED|nr:hypothetical protein [Sinomonas mesophila]
MSVLTALIALLLGGVLALRTVSALRRRTRPGPALLSAILGFIALMTTGVLVPEGVLDGWLGGTNLLHLIRNLLVLGAVWNLRRAIALVIDVENKRSNPTPLLVLCLVVSVFFASHSHEGTHPSFIPAYAHLPGIWAYGTLYMAGVLWMALDIVRGMREGRLEQLATPPRLASMWLFSGGGVLMGAASALEIGYMTEVLLHGNGTPLAVGLYPWFSPLLYGGIGFIVLGLLIPPVLSALGRLAVRLANSRRHALAAPVFGLSASSSAIRAFVSADPQADTYNLFIRLRDRAVAGNSLPPPVELLLQEMNRKFTRSASFRIPEEVCPSELHN